MFKSVSNKVSFPAMEDEILRFWADKKIFEQSVKQRESAKPFVFYDGPPFATGLPHYGHLLAGTIKDIIPRYMTMRGHHVQRRFGWDCHGLPIEALAQEALGLAGAGAIKEAGIDVFNEKCRSMVLTYVSEWRKTVTRMGRWVDFDNDYKTMDATFMESIWWVFRQLWDQGRIYRAYRIMPYSWKLTTPLSNFEAGNNYKMVQDPDITVRLRLTGGHPLAGEGNPPLYALIWTTTPWTLPENLAVCAGPDIDYVIVEDKAGGERYLLAEARLAAHYKKEEDYKVLEKFKGTALKGWTYEPLFPYFRNQPGSFRILVDAFVSTGDGTGIVHLAPAYGEDDYRVCRAEGIDLVDPLDEECRFTKTIPEYAGMFCKDADKLIIKRLKDEGKLVRHSTLEHSYPFCERTDTPLIYRAIDAWYVKVEDMRDELDSISRDQCGALSPEDQSIQAHSLLLSRHEAVLAMTTGGCARYIFSTDAHYCLDRRGHPLINYSSGNPHHHLIMTNSSMDLRLVHQTDADGNEMSLLILSGMLRLVDPGDHDSIDRYSRYYDTEVENYSRGTSRLYRFESAQACFEQFSGKRFPLTLEAIIRKNSFSEKDELSLLAFARDVLRVNKVSAETSVAGIDGAGVDLKRQGRFYRWTFSSPVSDKEQAELLLTGMGDLSGIIT